MDDEYIDEADAIKQACEPAGRDTSSSTVA